jgi:hypothetical protein
MTELNFELTDSEAFRILHESAKPVLAIDGETIGVARSCAGAVHLTKCRMGDYSVEEYGELPVRDVGPFFLIG